MLRKVTPVVIRNRQQCYVGETQWLTRSYHNVAVQRVENTTLLPSVTHSTSKFSYDEA